MYYYVTSTEDEEPKYHPCIKLSVALFLRLMEYAKETQPSDDKLHEIAEEILELLKDKEPHKYLKMKHYADIVN